MTEICHDQSPRKNVAGLGGDQTHDLLINVALRKLCLTLIITVGKIFSRQHTEIFLFFPENGVLTFPFSWKSKKIFTICHLQN